MNGAVCRSSSLNYSCECLTTSYSGRHCEIVSTSLIMQQVISKSFGYIAMTVMIAVISFIVIMDILKYGFGIDSNKNDLARIRRMKTAKRHRRPPVIIRFSYVNAPPRESVPVKNVETDTHIEQNNV